MVLTDKVKRVLAGESISTEELEYMLAQAAITSMRDCNRRYYAWLFRVEGNTLLDMQRVDLVELGHGPTAMLEEHDACSGAGCRACGWVGSVSRAIADTTARYLTNQSG
jgi:hypothetical protein